MSSTVSIRLPVLGPIRPARLYYLIFLFALLCVQTLARLVLNPRTLGGNWIGAALHLATIAAFLAAVTLLVSRLPIRWRGFPMASATVVLVLGTAHATTTLFDVAQFAMRHYSGMNAPVGLVFSDPGLAISLLNSVDIGPAKVALTLILLLAVHLLLYVPVASELARLARNLMAAAPPLPIKRRVPLLWLALGYLLIFGAMTLYVPAQFWAAEAFHRGNVNGFQMAPPELLVSAKDPPPVLGPKTDLPGARPLILIIVDALRSDRMAIYDPAKAPTPFLSGLRKQGALKRYQSYSTCSFSACGIMSILASRSWDDFGRRPPTVIEALSRHSYRNYLLLAGSHTGFGLLTQLYGPNLNIQDQRTDETPNDSALLSMLHKTDFPDPAHSFLYLHVISAHGGSFVRPRYRVSENPLGTGRGDKSPDAYREQYDMRVSQVDEVLSQIFAELAAKGLLKNALVIITADHGERIGEHGLYYHGGRADGPVTTVPLLIYDASSMIYPDRAFTSQIDIAPTFLRAVGGEPLAGWRGHALQETGWPGAVPLGTFENTGIVAELPGGPYRYLCDREAGVEHVQRIDGSSPEGTAIRDSSVLAGLLPRLRALHRSIAEPPAGLCRH